MKRTEMRELAFKTIYSRFFNNSEEEVTDLGDESNLTHKILSCHEANKQDIEAKIAANLKGYTLERVYKIDLAILCLAVAEIFYVKENPTEVVINEAVELAKKYSTEKSPKFINGVLADIIK
ncbi:MAG: transcription antitermination factor NusB [Clostridia bacterium]|nr:transcription antitermination factor NusB [Clostridia bacterium]